MNIIIGLGNPGIKYNKTRHNIGFRIVDEYARENNFPRFKLSKKHNSLLSENNGTILVKPQTFMNESGKAVKSLIKFYKDSTFIIIHDDVDLLLKKIKISKNKGSAGHKGIESIIKEIGNKDIVRLRIGIQIKQPKITEKFVIQKFTKKEEEAIKGVLQNSKKAIDSFLNQGLEKTMNQYNKGFLSMIALLMGIILIGIITIMILQRTFFKDLNNEEKKEMEEIFPDSDSVKMLEVPEAVEKNLENIQQDYDKKIQAQ